MSELRIDAEEPFDETVSFEGARELVISGSQPFDAPWYQTVEPWCAMLGARGSSSLERLIVDTHFQPLTRQASVYCGDVTQIFRRCPNLEFVYLIGAAEISELSHLNLEQLTLMSDPMSPATIRAIAGGRAPKLRSLSIGLSYERVRPRVRMPRSSQR